MNSRGFNVYAALEDNLGLNAIQDALPAGHAGARGLPRGRRPRRQRSPPGADLVIVGCSESHDRAVEVISAANAQRADRPIVVLYHGSPNGFLERAFDAGADDLVALPQSAAQLGFALEKALARRRGGGAATAEGAMITVLGPKGGTGKTVTSSNLAVALALEGIPQCSSISTCSSATSGSRSAWSRPGRSTTSLSPAVRSTPTRSTAFSQYTPPA